MNDDIKEEVKEESKSPQPRNKRTRGRKPKQAQIEEKWEDRPNKCNDPAWYSMDPALLRDAAQIPFNWVAGSRIPLNGGNPNLVDLQIPGICSLTLRPTIGLTQWSSDPVNVASQAIYAYVRHANSGARNYDAMDLMIYLIAVSNVYAYITWLTRLYAIACTYSSTNRYVPHALFKAAANGKASFNDVINNLANFRYGINRLINKAAAFAVPANMPIFQRMAFLYRDVYMEGTSPKDQMYLYCPDKFYVYDEMDSSHYDGAGYLHLLDMSGAMTVTSLMDYGDQLLEPLLGSTDVGLIYGDIIKAYGDATIKLASIPEVVPLEPKSDIGVLEQMHNATVLNCIRDGSSRVTMSNVDWDIHPDPNKGFLQSSPKIYIPIESPTDTQVPAIMAAFHESKLLTTRTAFTDPSLVAESSRLMATVTGIEHGEAGGNSSATVICATEVVVNCHIYGGTGSYTLTDESSWGFVNVTSGTSSDHEKHAAGLRLLGCASTFDFRPNARLLVMGPRTPIDAGYFGDLGNVAVIDNSILERLHQTCLLSLYNVTPINKLM